MTTAMPRALFRCDASAAIGAGHVTRCLALAEALAECGWRVAFAVNPDTTAMMPAIAASGFSVHELVGAAEDEPALLRGYHPGGIALLVVDHYHRDIHFEEACRGWAGQILVMDDATGRQHDCDFLVDAAASDDLAYKDAVPAHARLLLGPHYALMRRAFIARRAEALRRRDGRPVENILVSFGATDPWNATSVALDALESFAKDYAITVALASQAPHLDEVRRKLNGRTELKLDADMAALMTEADLAIGAAGASAYERAVLGLPSIVVTLADNQRGICRCLIDAGAAACAGSKSDVVPELAKLTRALASNREKRLLMARNASSLVDGLGSRKIAELVS
jgi:UDP-2,4-diacetamido-2,4,6-trideoxy-beta-L-altropyranose hydrolase